MLPAPEYEYAGQSLHADADVAAEAVPYVPARHSVHAADPFTSLKLPAAQEVGHSTVAHILFLAQSSISCP